MKKINDTEKFIKIVFLVALEVIGAKILLDEL